MHSFTGHLSFRGLPQDIVLSLMLPLCKFHVPGVGPLAPWRRIGGEEGQGSKAEGREGGQGKGVGEIQGQREAQGQAFGAHQLGTRLECVQLLLR